ncbi:MAG: hypothetical protein WA060_03080 [Minisyncoccia bacterium]
MSSMDKLNNRVSEVEARDRELGGFLTFAAKFLPETRLRLVKDIERLKIDCADDKERFKKGLAAMHQELKDFGDDYGLVKRVEDKK